MTPDFVIGENSCAADHLVIGVSDKNTGVHDGQGLAEFLLEIMLQALLQAPCK